MRFKNRYFSEVELAATKEMCNELKENLLGERETVKQLRRDLDSLPLLQRQLALICELDDYIYPIRPVSFSNLQLWKQCFS